MVPKVWFAVVPTVLVLVAIATAQQPRFATATVARSMAPSDTRPVNRVTDDGGYLATNVTLKALIEAAYRRSGFDRREVIGGPEWITTDRFDVIATLPKPVAIDADGFPRQSLRMLQELLKEQFQLRAVVREQHRPVYALVRTNVVGPRLSRSSVDCAAVQQAFARGERGMKMCGAAPYPGRLTASGISIADLAGLITPYVDRLVIDDTGLHGRFDIDLEGVEFRPPGPFGPSYRPSETKESVFKLIQPQLGLELHPTTGAIETIFVQHAARLEGRQ